ncbi:MAG: DUF3027 domain-containing protein [Candidatus Nanopelagicales bacterium]
MSKLKNRNRKVKLTPKKTEPVAAEVASEVPEELTATAVEAVVIETTPEIIETVTSEPAPVLEPAKPITYITEPSKPIKLDFKIDQEVARDALTEVTDAAHVGKHISTQPTSERTAIVTFEAKMPGYQNWNWLVMLSWLDASHLTIDEVAMVPTDDALIAPAWVPWSDRLQAGDLGIGDELPYRANDPSLAPGYVAESDLLDEQETLRPFWWSLGLGRERVLSATGREYAAERWYAGEFSGSAIMAKVAQGKCISCGYFNPLAGSLGSAFGACTNAVSPADGKVVAANFGCGAHSETDSVEEPVATIDLVYDDTYDQGLSAGDDDNVDELEN